MVIRGNHLLDLGDFHERELVDDAIDLAEEGDVLRHVARHLLELGVPGDQRMGGRGAWRALGCASWGEGAKALAKQLGSSEWAQLRKGSAVQGPQAAVSAVEGWPVEGWPVEGWPVEGWAAVAGRAHCSTNACMSEMEEICLELFVLAWKLSIIVFTSSARSP